MKGYCKCGKEIDEVEFTQFDGMCEECYSIINDYWRGYEKGYQDALDDCKEEENDGEHYNINEDYD